MMRAYAYLPVLQVQNEGHDAFLLQALMTLTAGTALSTHSPLLMSQSAAAYVKTLAVTTQMRL
jgi:hypothetical protein